MAFQTQGQGSTPKTKSRGGKPKRGKNKAKPKMVIKQPGVFLSTVKGKEQEAAEETIEAISHAVKRLYPGILGDWDDEESIGDGYASFEEELAKELKNLEQIDTAPAPTRFRIVNIGMDSQAYIAFDSYIDPEKLVHEFLKQSQSEIELKYTLRITPFKIICPADPEVVRNTIKAAAIPYFARLEEVLGRSPTYKIVFASKESDKIKQNDFVNDSSNIIQGRDIDSGDADVVVSVLSTRNMVGVAFLQDYESLNGYCIAGNSQATLLPDNTTDNGTEEDMDEVEIPGWNAQEAPVEEDVKPIIRVSPPLGEPAAEHAGGIQQAPDVFLTPRQPMTHPDFQQTYPQPSPSLTQIPPYKLMLPVKRDPSNPSRCWHCGASEEHFAKIDKEQAEHWKELLAERKALEKLRREIEEQTSNSGEGSGSGSSRRKRGFSPQETVSDRQQQSWNKDKKRKRNETAPPPMTPGQYPPYQQQPTWHSGGPVGSGWNQPGQPPHIGRDFPPGTSGNPPPMGSYQHFPPPHPSFPPTPQQHPRAQQQQQPPAYHPFSLTTPSNESNAHLRRNSNEMSGIMDPKYDSSSTGQWNRGSRGGGQNNRGGGRGGGNSTNYNGGSGGGRGRGGGGGGGGRGGRNRAGGE